MREKGKAMNTCFLIASRALRSYIVQLAAVCLLAMIAPQQGSAQEKTTPKKYKNILVIPIKGEIGKALPFTVRRGLVRAQNMYADAVVLRIDTLGGDLWQTQYIRDTLFECRCHTFAYVQRAISAGALLALATDFIYIENGGTIGAGEAWSWDGGVPKGKLISVGRETFKATAKRKGHDPEIAEAFADPDYALKGYQKKGEPLTLDPEDALELGLVEGVYDNFDDFLKATFPEAEEIKVQKLTGAEYLARFVSQMGISWIFLVLGIIGISTELKAPGFGFPGILGILCLALFFWGNYIALLANWLEILFFVIGIGLIVLEVTVVPGFGVAGIAGAICVLASIFLATFRLPPEGITFEVWRLKSPLTTMMLTALLGIIGSTIAVWSVRKTWVWKKIVLDKDLASEDGFISSPDLSALVGSEGVAFSDLRPSGVVKIDTKRYDAVTQGDFIDEDTPVKVIGIQAYSLLVEALSDEDTN